ncbi:hypothetical protein F4810DRAFT_705376 [Camillea tinctor]|nr:hypothetical protein F4810DRAFT_705376 [Camillea tinctor]
MSGGNGTPVKTPGSDVSPGSQPTPKKFDYFSLERRKTARTSSAKGSPGGVAATEARVTNDAKDKSKLKETENTGDASATTPGETGSSSGSSEPPSRKDSISSVTFRAPRNPSLPQGLKKPHGGSRIRDASPPHRSRMRWLAGYTESSCRENTTAVDGTGGGGSNYANVTRA